MPKMWILSLFQREAGYEEGPKGPVKKEPSIETKVYGTLDEANVTAVLLAASFGRVVADISQLVEVHGTTKFGLDYWVSVTEHEAPQSLINAMIANAGPGWKFTP